MFFHNQYATKHCDWRENSRHWTSTPPFTKPGFNPQLTLKAQLYNCR